MRKTMVELFSGSKTVSRQFEKHNWKAWSVDINPKLNPSMCCDILELNPNMLPEDVQFIWASPDCSTFSRAASTSHWHKRIIKYRQYEYYPISKRAEISLKLLTQTVMLIKANPGALFVIENPIGRIRHLKPLKNLGHYRYFVNYADYGFFYSKETYLFSNFFLPFSTKITHSISPGFQNVNSRLQRPKVPAMLVDEIIKHIP